MIQINKSNPFNYEIIEQRENITFAQQRDAVYTTMLEDENYQPSERDTYVYGTNPPEPSILSVDGYNPKD